MADAVSYERAWPDDVYVRLVKQADKHMCARQVDVVDDVHAVAGMQLYTHSAEHRDSLDYSTPFYAVVDAVVCVKQHRSSCEHSYLTFGVLALRSTARSAACRGVDCTLPYPWLAIISMHTYIHSSWL